MWLRIRRLLLSLSRFSYPASLGTHIGVRRTRSGVLKYLSRTKDRRSGDQFFICTREPFSPASRDVISKWIVAAIRAAGPSVLSPGVTPRAHDTRSIRRVLGVVYGGFSVEEIRQPIGQSPNSSSPLYFRDVPAAELFFFLCSPAGGGIFPLIPFTALFGGHAARPPALFLCGSSKE